MAIILFLAKPQTANAGSENDLAKMLAPMAGEMALSYLKPVSSAYGANLNAGWVHRVPQSPGLIPISFDFEVSFVFMGTMFSSADKNFNKEQTFSYPFKQSDAIAIADKFNYGSIPVNLQAQAKQSIISQLSGQSISFKMSVSGPTITGSSKDSVKVKFLPQSMTVNVGGTNYTVNNTAPVNVTLPVTGYLGEIPVMPLMMPQISIGTIFGTNLTLRWLPEIPNPQKDMPKYKVFGWGIQHNFSQYMLFMPIDLSIGYFTQKIKIESIFESTSSEYGVFAAKEFGLDFLNITPYGGFTLETANTKVTYNQKIPDPTDPLRQIDLPINFDIKGDNKTKFTLGLALRITALTINADYSVSKYKTYSLGAGFIF